MIAYGRQSVGAPTHLAGNALLRYISAAFRMLFSSRKDATHDSPSPFAVFGDSLDPRNDTPAVGLGLCPGDADRPGPQGKPDRRFADDTVLRPADQRRVGDRGDLPLLRGRHVSRSLLRPGRKLPAHAPGAAVFLDVALQHES